MNGTAAEETPPVTSAGTRQQRDAPDEQPAPSAARVSRDPASSTFQPA